MASPSPSGQAAATSERGGSTSHPDGGTVDPTRLSPWTGNLAQVSRPWEFAMPLGTRMMLAEDPSASRTMQPGEQSIYSVFHILRGIGTKPQITRRHILQFDARSAAILLDFIHRDVAVLCPQEVPHFEWDEAATIGGIPLLPVRYRHVQPDDYGIVLRLTSDACLADINVPEAEARNRVLGIQTAQAESVADIDATLRMLEDNSRLLSPAYVAAFRAQSQFHDEEAGFHVSFLSPPAEFVARVAPVPKVVCSYCRKLPPKGNAFKVCSRCRCESYCDPVCQKAHWKAGHKSRCKSAEELKNETTSSTRPSVVFPVTGSKSLAGMHSAFINMRASGLQTSKPKISGKITKNIHGDNEFVVKVQVGDASDPCLVYDECRSFQISIFQHEVEGLPMVARLIRHGGPMGRKGYFAARREGANIRLFYDRLIPPPPW